MSRDALSLRHCREYPAGSKPLEELHRAEFARSVPRWELQPDRKSISRTFDFAGFPQAISFVVRLAAIAETEQHHPDIRIHGYRRVTLDFTTHSVGGLTENDFIMAAKFDVLYASPENAG